MVSEDDENESESEDDKEKKPKKKSRKEKNSSSSEFSTTLVEDVEGVEKDIKKKIDKKRKVNEDDKSVHSVPNKKLKPESIKDMWDSLNSKSNVKVDAEVSEEV